MNGDYRVWCINSDDRAHVERALSECGAKAFTFEFEGDWNRVLPSPESAGLLGCVAKSFDAAIGLFGWEPYGFTIYRHGERVSNYAAPDGPEPTPANAAAINFRAIQGLAGLPELDVPRLARSNLSVSDDLTVLQLVKLYRLLLSGEVSPDEYSDGGPNEVLAELLPLGKLEGSQFEEYWPEFQERPEDLIAAFPDIAYIC